MAFKKKTEGASILQLEDRERFLEEHIRKLERDEKKLSEKLEYLEERELKLAMKVSNLQQVRKRKPEFLTNYIASRNNKPLEEDKPIEDVKIADFHKKKAKDTVKEVLETHGAEKFNPPTKKERCINAEKLLKDVLSKPVEEKSLYEEPMTKREGKAKKVLSNLLSAKKESNEPDLPQSPDLSLDSERKHIHAAQIKNVLEKKNIRKEPETQNKKAPIKQFSMGLKNSESVQLFRLLLSKGVMTIDEAASQLSENKKVVETWAKELETNGIIDVNKPLYGSPTLKLKVLTERMQKTINKL